MRQARPSGGRGVLGRLRYPTSYCRGRPGRGGSRRYRRHRGGGGWRSRCRWWHDHDTPRHTRRTSRSWRPRRAGFARRWRRLRAGATRRRGRRWDARRRPTRRRRMGGTDRRQRRSSGRHRDDRITEQHRNSERARRSPKHRDFPISPDRLKHPCDSSHCLHQPSGRRASAADSLSAM